MILVIDNYDSFIHNLARYVRELGQETKIFRNDHVTVSECLELQPQGVILSPGPGRPTGAGICIELVQNASTIPILGVCLGHQAIVEAYGGCTINSREPVHGRSSLVTHYGDELFEGLCSPFPAGRYHSLSVDSEHSNSLITTAQTDDGEVMGIRHKTFPHYGVQFHPESILTPDGKNIVQNFLKIARDEKK